MEQANNQPLNHPYQILLDLDRKPKLEDPPTEREPDQASSTSIANIEEFREKLRQKLHTFNIEKKDHESNH